MAEGDTAKTAVPVILGAGLLALFTLPNSSGRIEDYSFNEDRHLISRHLGLE